MSGDTLLVTALPRGSSYGGSAIAAIDLATLTLLAVRPIPASEYLRDPLGDSERIVPHCRGLARHGGALAVAMFNAIGIYEVGDARNAELTQSRLLTHPAAVDLHGISSRGGRLFASSTGADAIVTWGDAEEAGTLHALRKAPTTDLRFPAAHALRVGATDWRHLLDAELHVNDVWATGRTAAVVCSLSRLFAWDDGRETILLDRPGSMLHDGRPARDGRLLVTDAATGELLFVDTAQPGGAVTSIAIADPASWFVRGTTVIGGHAVVLQSEVTATRQRQPRAGHSTPDAPSGGRCRITVVDLATRAVAARSEVSLPGVAPGSVVYAAVLWPSAPPQSDAQN